MEKVKKHSPLLILGLLLLGVCMRMPITSIPSVIKEIAQTFNVAPTSLGILTTIPLLCFGLLSSVVSATAQRIGNELTIAIAMVLMFIGSYLRIISFPLLMVGTILVGVAITCINVLLPAIITDKFPERIGSITGMYNTAMTLFAAIGAYAITPITHQSSWQTAVILISLIALIQRTRHGWPASRQGNQHVERSQRLVATAVLRLSVLRLLQCCSLAAHNRDERGT